MTRGEGIQSAGPRPRRRRRDEAARRRVRCILGVAALGVTGACMAERAATTAEDFLVVDRVVDHGDAANHVRVFGRDADAGATVTIVPSLGRGVEDYTELYHSTLTTRLVEAGYRVVLVQPRGIGKSTGDLTPAHASMSRFAQDLEATFDALGIEHLHMVGHAFGNRLARTFATLHPTRVDGLVLLASGGGFPLSPEQTACLLGSFDTTLPDAERLERIRCAFFARGNDPSVWQGGWYPDLAAAQSLAARMIDGRFFERAGGKPFLLVQAAEDFIAPPERAGRPLAAKLGDQVTYVEIPNAGHALTSEQPDLVAARVVEYLGRVATESLRE